MRTLILSVCLAVLSSSSLRAFGAPDLRNSTGPTPPAGGAPSPPATAGAPALPRIYEGFVTPEEFAAITAYEKSIRTDPEVAELNARIQALAAQLQPLQVRLDAARKRVLADNPAMDAIAKKMRTAILSHLAANPTAVAPAGAKPVITLPAAPKTP